MGFSVRVRGRVDLGEEGAHAAADGRRDVADDLVRVRVRAGVRLGLELGFGVSVRVRGRG